MTEEQKKLVDDVVSAVKEVADFNEMRERAIKSLQAPETKLFVLVVARSDGRVDRVAHGDDTLFAYASVVLAKQVRG